MGTWARKTKGVAGSHTIFKVMTPDTTNKVIEFLRRLKEEETYSCWEMSDVIFNGTQWKEDALELLVDIYNDRDDGE